MNATMEHARHSGHSMMNVNCDGSLGKPKGGTLKGHVGPGVLFIVWGAWWTYSVLSYLIWSAKHSHSFRFSSKSWYPMPSRWFRFTEPALKIFLPLAYVSVELYFDHADGFQYLRCPQGTLYAGRFALPHMNNWQHASTYPPIVLSGLIELLSTRVPLPPGTGHVFLAVAFAVQAFVMGTHQKHQPQDQMVHWLLFLSMLLCLLFIILELHAPRNPLPALGRGAAAIFQGAWLCCIGVIEFEKLPQWSEEYPGGVMIAPIYFVTVAVLVLCAVVLLGPFMAVLDYFHLVPHVLLFPDSGTAVDAAASHFDGEEYINGIKSRYLELARHDVHTQHAQHDVAMNLLPLSSRGKNKNLHYSTLGHRNKPYHTRYSDNGNNNDVDDEFAAFETDSALHTATTSSSSSHSPCGEFAVPLVTLHQNINDHSSALNPQDLV